MDRFLEDFRQSSSQLNSFLEDASQTFAAKKSKSYHFVMGNEASDMDSIVSSIALAYLNYKTHDRNEALYFPVINIPREDFVLRTETDYLFSKIGLDKGHLLFFPEIEKDLEQLKDQVHLILVDHNKLAKSQEKFGSSVEFIIDHHKDEGLYVPSDKRMIQMVGSCCALVAEKIYHQNSEVLNESLSLLLLGTILLDTVNLDPQYKKVTPTDELFATKLFSHLKWTDPTINTRLFEILQEKRFDVSSLGTYDLLRADYKQWQMKNVMVGISSCKRSFQEWFTKDQDITQESEKTCVNNKLDILFIMTQFMDPHRGMQRELGIYSKNKKLHDEAIAFLKTTDLGLEPIFSDVASRLSKGDAVVISFYHQKNIGASRKQLQPFLDEFYSKN